MNHFIFRLFFSILLFISLFSACTSNKKTIVVGTPITMHELTTCNSQKLPMLQQNISSKSIQDLTIVKTLCLETPPLGTSMFVTDSIIASVSGFNVFLHDITTGELKQTITHSLQKTGSEIYFAASPDGKVIATSHYYADEVKLWEVSSGKLLQLLKLDTERYNNLITQLHPQLVTDGPDAITGLFFSPQGKIIGVGTKKGLHQLWQVSTGESLYYGDVDVSQVTADGETLVIDSLYPKYPEFSNKQYNSDRSMYALMTSESDVNNRLEVYRASDDNLLFSQTGNLIPAEYTQTFAFSPDGTKIAAAKREQERVNIKLWNISTGVELRSFSAPGPHEWGASLRFVDTDDGNRLVATGRKVRIWQVDDGKLLLNSVIRTTDFSSDYRKFIGYETDIDGSNDVIGNQFYVWDVSNGKKIASLKVHQSKVHNLKVSTNNLNITSLNYRYTPQIVSQWNLNNETLNYSIEPKNLDFADETVSIESIDLDRDFLILRQYVFNPNHEVDISFIQSDDLKQVKTIRVNEYNGSYVNALSPNQNILITGGYGSLFSLWEVASGKQLHAGSLGGQITDFLFSPDSEVIAVSTPSVVYLLDVKSGQLVHEFSDKPFYFSPTFPRQMVFSPDSQTILFSSKDISGVDSLEARDVLTGQKVSLKGDLKDQQSLRYKEIKYSPDGKILAIVKYIQEEVGDTVELWRVSDGNLLKTLDGHYDISSIDFSSDGETLIVGSGHIDHKNTVTIYSTPNNDPVFINQDLN